MESSKWFAVYTRPRWEKKVADLLSKKGIIQYCPINKVMRQWRDRKKMIQEPLFRSYVFVNVNPRQMNEVLETSGVVRFVTQLGRPAPIREVEIQMVREFLNEHSDVRVDSIPAHVYDRVRVTRGPLADLEGDIVELRHRRLRVILPSLGYMMSVEIDRQDVEYVSRRTALKSS